MLEAMVREWNDVLRFERSPLLVGRQWQITQLYCVLADYLDRRDGGNRVERLVTFFDEYFVSLQKQQDASDRIRLVLRVLPEVLRTKASQEGGWFHIKTVHEVVIGYLEEDAKEYYKTRSVSKHLEVLGFRKRRASKQGQQVWLDADAIRSEFRQRRVEPAEDDKAWLDGTVEYDILETAITTRTNQAKDDLWASMAEQEEPE